MITFTRFAVTRRCFSTCAGWQTYSSFMDCADPITLASAEALSRRMDWKESTTLSVAPIR